MSKTAQIVHCIQADIDQLTRDLTDAEYMDVLEELEGYVDTCYVAKKEELEG